MKMLLCGSAGYGKSAYADASNAKDAGFAKLWNDAYAAGLAAVEQLAVRPMIVSGGGKQWFVADGVCGFAWVSLAGNSAFGKWGKAKGLFSKAYPKGVWYWVGEFNQSMQKKEAFAAAVAAHLRENGVDAYSDSRMD
jgi:hypothetical protein